MKRKVMLNKPIIAITGSAGKTTTKEMIASILQQRWKIFKSEGNNNMPGHTLKHIKKIKYFHRGAVLEYAMSRFGHIKLHCQLLKPNIGVITSIGSAHMGNVRSLTGVAVAKSELIKHMDQKGTLFLNKDDENSKLLLTKGFKGKIVTVGVNNHADYRGYLVKYTRTGMEFYVKLKGKFHKFSIPIYGKHNVNNALLAIAVSDHLGLNPKVMKQRLQTFYKSNRRLFIHDFKRGIKIIDDTYSSNPHATKAAVDVLTSIGKKNNIVVLGSMLEMGRYSEIIHRNLGKDLASRNIHQLYTYGNDAKPIVDGAIKSGFPRTKVRHFSLKSKLHQHLLKIIKPRDTILVKGSHRMKMNETVAYLKNYLKKSRNRHRNNL